MKEGEFDDSKSPHYEIWVTTAAGENFRVDGQIERAKADTAAIVIAFGDYFQDAQADEIFGFSPATGVHDIHLMQFDRGRFAADDRTNGDGALFIRYTGGETVALFTRFSTQIIPAQP